MWHEEGRGVIEVNPMFNLIFHKGMPTSESLFTWKKSSLGTIALSGMISIYYRSHISL